MSNDSGLTYNFNDEQARTLKENIEIAASKLSRVSGEIGKRVFGQRDMIENTLISIIAGGHVLLEGNPGLAKTLLATTVAEVIGINSSRIQYNPDTSPADILGYERINPATGEFNFFEGAVFTNLLLADEINRGSPRVQAALLQAMQEKEVTVSGKTTKLDRPFHVIATQNPLEQEGTNPLPEAQLDRFLMRIEIPYPDRATEFMIATMEDKISVDNILTKDELIAIQELVTNDDPGKKMPVSKDVAEFVVDLVRLTRPEENKDLKDQVEFGAGPRAIQALIKTANVRALIRGDVVASIDDVKALAFPVLNHRIGLSFQARMGAANDTDARKQIIDSIVKQAENLRQSPAQLAHRQRGWEM